MNIFDNMMASFWYVQEESTEDILVIRDANGKKSITNDAENVVEFLFLTHKLYNGRRLWYYDSTGRKDEILIKDGKFAGFAPINKENKKV